MPSLTIFLITLVAIYLSGCEGLRIAILGASGYTGAELMRLLQNHPNAKVEVLSATDRNAGQDFKTLYPQFSYVKNLPKLTKWEESHKDIEACDVAFCCLPHGTTQEIISKLAESPVKVLSTYLFLHIIIPCDHRSLIYQLTSD